MNPTHWERSLQIASEAMIVVSGPTSKVNNQLVKLQFDGTMAGASVPVISITDEVAERWLAISGKNLNDLQTELDTGEPQMGFEIKGLSLTAGIDILKVKRTGRNVIGRLKATDLESNEAIMVCAHIDHLGGITDFTHVPMVVHKAERALDKPLY